MSSAFTRTHQLSERAGSFSFIITVVLVVPLFPTFARIDTDDGAFSLEPHVQLPAIAQCVATMQEFTDDDVLLGLAMGLEYRLLKTTNRAMTGLCNPLPLTFAADSWSRVGPRTHLLDIADFRTMFHRPGPGICRQQQRNQQRYFLDRHKHSM